MIMALKNTGKILADIRRSRGFTQVELANKVGMHPQALSNSERGLNMPPKKSLKKLKRALGLTKIDRVNIQLAIENDVIDAAREEFKDLIS